MRYLVISACITSVMVAGCSQSEDESVEYVTTADMAEPPAAQYEFSEEADDSSRPSPPLAPPLPTDGQANAQNDAQADVSEPLIAGGIPTALPQIAYSYAYGFRMPSEAIKPMQERHADMCEAKGPDICRIISMSQADEQGDYAYGNLQLAIATAEARDFGKQLAGAAKSSDGELVSNAIQGEDLSKRIVDTEARLRARTVLRDRLMEVLRTRKGTVAELVEAERGVAQVNEEIDQARSWLTEMRGRVAFSQMSISYQSGSPSSGGFFQPIRRAFNAFGDILGGVIGGIIMFTAWLLPVGLLVAAAVWIWRRFGLQLPFRKASSEKFAPDA